MIIPAVLIGLSSSIITEIFKFIPFLSKSDLRKQIVAFLVTLVLVIGFVVGNPEISGVEGFVAVLLLSLTIAYGTYKTILKGITRTIGLSKLLGESQ